MKKLKSTLYTITLLLFSLTLLSQTRIDTLEKKLKTAEGKEKINILINLSEQFLSDEFYNNEKCLDLSNQALDLSRKLENKNNEAIALKYIGFAYYYQQKYDTSIIIFNNVLKILENFEDIQVKDQVYNVIGACYYYKGDFNRTLEFWKKRLELSKQIGNNANTAESYMNLGVIYKNMDEYDQAISYYQEAYKIREERKDSTEMANVLNNIGNIYFQFRGNYTKALENYLKAIEIYKKKGDKENEAIFLNNIGLIYDKQDQNQMALNNFNQALTIFKSLKNKDDKIAETQNYLGVLNAELGNFQMAYEYLNNSYIYYIGIGAKPRVAETLKDLGDVYTSWKRYNDALKTYNQSFEIFTELNMKSDISNLYLKLAETNANLNNFKKAFEFHVLYTHLNDSLFTEKLNEQITEIQTKYETEKKDKEIALLNSDKALKDATLKKQRLTIFIFIGGFFLVAISLVIIFRLYKQKQKANIILEQKNEEISLQRDFIFQQNKEITSSIEYAKRIQNALLPPQELIDAIIPDSFILFKPRDIVSGDFYWLNQKENKIISVTADCTGHGVPGAFMSMLGISFINEIINITKTEELRSNQVLDHLRELIITSLRQTGKQGESRDGMDMTICIIDIENKTLDFAGAYNPMYLVRNGELIEAKPDKMPIGIHVKELGPFTNQIFQIEKGDIVYTCSDGYADQFGGPDNNKYRRKNFKDLLLQIHKKEMNKQKEILDKTLMDWMEGFEQVDDILVCGIRIS